MRYAKFNYITFRMFLLELIENNIISCPGAWTSEEYISDLIERYYPLNIDNEDLVLHSLELISDSLRAQSEFRDRYELLSSHFHEKESK